MKIAILGSGSLGIIIGGLITKSRNYDVDLIDINKENVAALNNDGAKIKGYLDLSIPVTAKQPKNLNDKYDLILLLTKQTYTHDSLHSILPFMHKNSLVCTLQNGVPEDHVASIVGEHNTVSGAVGFGATWLGPGTSELTTIKKSLEKHAFTIGEIDGRITSRIKKVQEVLSAVGECEISPNIKGVKWSKLLMNATFSGVSTALGCTFGDVLNNSIAMNAVANIADETIKVAHAHHIKLAEIDGINFEYLELDNIDDINEKLDFYYEVWEPHKNLKASMLQDLEKGVKTEIEYINGFVSKMGREVGILTPYNNLVSRFVNESESRKTVPNFDTNVAIFSDLINTIV